MRLDTSPYLSDHDAISLGARIAARTGVSPARGQRCAARALRHAFGPAGIALGLDDAPSWDATALADAGIGGWAHEALVDFTPASRLRLDHRAPSDDGTERLLFRTEDGHLIEAVIIPAEDGRDRPRTTLCISSQVGCARACTFCETGAHGLVRQLEPGEIVDQYRYALALCRDAARPLDLRTDAPTHPAEHAARHRRERGLLIPAALRPISNIVFMGMGEPFDNFPAVRQAIAALTTQQSFDFAPKRITVSTVGRVDMLETFFVTTRAELAVSIHAPDDARRSAMMPINRRHDLAELRAALVRHLPRGRRVLLQYVLFARFNDRVEDADALADWVGELPARVNLIPANPGPDPSLRASPRARVDAFVERLASRGITTLVRRPRGRDVGGACGQLAGRRRLALASEMR